MKTMLALFFLFIIPFLVFYMAFRYTSIKYSGLFFGGFYGKYFEVTCWN